MQEKPNLNYIKQLAGNDIDFELKFVGILKQEFPTEHETYLTSINNNQMEDAVQIVHKLKHKFNILSMAGAYALAVSYEEELKNNIVKRDTDFREVLNTVATYLKTI